MKKFTEKPDGKKLTTTQSVDSAIWDICDIMRRSNCAGALQYVPELTWILFLRILDELETREAADAAAVEADFKPSIKTPYRWHDWAAPYNPPPGTATVKERPSPAHPTGTHPAQAAKDRPTDSDHPQGWKRKQLTDGAMGQFKEFVNEKLIPYLKSLRDHPNATPRQKIIGEIMADIDQTKIDTEKNLLDILDKVHAISNADVDPTHVFLLSQVYEGLLLRMGEKGNDGGQFFTPREIIRAVVKTVAPQINETIYDPCCGTGGFLAEAFKFILTSLGKKTTPDRLEKLKHHTFFGREKENLIFPIALANMMLHGIDEPHLWHGNTLTGNEVYGGLFHGAPALFNVILTNPPFGGKEGKEAQTNFPYKTSATQILFLQHVISSLAPNGRCGIVLDEGVLFRTNETAFVQTKRKLLDECDLYCIVSLPAGVFSATGAGVKTNLLFFNKSPKGTQKIWYYDLSDHKVGKRTPFTLDKFDDFFKLLPTRADSPRSWTVTREQIEAKNFDLKAVNPNAKTEVDTRTPTELLDLIEQKQKEITAALTHLRSLT